MSEYNIVMYIPQYALDSSFLNVVLGVFKSMVIGVAPFSLMWFGIRTAVKAVTKAAQGGDFNV